MHDRIRAAFPGIELIGVPPGFPSELPAAATVFFASPHRVGPHSYPPRPTWVDRIGWIQLLSAGADGYPPWYFDVGSVTCSRGPTALPVAEFAMAAVFAHAKRFPSSWIASSDLWRPSPLSMVQGATLGIVGFGAIGSTLARMAAAFGMRVIVSRRNAMPLQEVGVEAVSLQELMRRSDHVVLAAPATAATHHLVEGALLQHAKPGLHLINVARGSLVDQDALMAALDRGLVSRATLDVTDPEPLPPGHPLYTHPGVQLSPHLSSYHPNLAAQLADVFITNLGRFMAGEPLLNAVDAGIGY